MATFFTVVVLLASSQVSVQVLLSFTCNYVISNRRGFLFLLLLGIGCNRSKYVKLQLILITYSLHKISSFDSSTPFM